MLHCCKHPWGPPHTTSQYLHTALWSTINTNHRPNAASGFKCVEYWNSFLEISRDEEKILSVTRYIPRLCGFPTGNSAIPANRPVTSWSVNKLVVNKLTSMKSINQMQSVNIPRKQYNNHKFIPASRKEIKLDNESI